MDDSLRVYNRYKVEAVAVSMASIRCEAAVATEFRKLYDAWIAEQPREPGAIGMMWVVPPEDPGDGRSVTFHNVSPSLPDYLGEQRFPFLGY